MNWLRDILGTDKAIIAMCHFDALPGDPGYDEDRGMDGVVQHAYEDLTALQEGGVDAVMFSNEFSMPYLTSVQPVTVAAMARIIGQLMPGIKVPFGVNALWDGERSLDLAAATGASFIREIMSGVYASDFGLWNTNSGEAARHRKNLGIPNVRMLYNIVPEAASYLGTRTIEDIARSTVFNCRADALCVSGLTAGVEANTQIIERVKNTVPDTVVFANTGCRPDNIAKQLGTADGAVVGTTFKKDGKFENHVDVRRVRAFMDEVRRFREARNTSV